MSDINVEELLQEISTEAPCGEDLEYDLAYGDMERAAEGTPEQQFGDTIVPAEDPDWRDLKRKASALLPRTKDLRVVIYLARAVIHIDGLPGFRDCIALLRGYIDQYWDTVYPQLDPDDDNDPTLRVNTLSTLCDADVTLRYVRKAPLVSSRAVGQFGLHDIEVARGEVPPAQGEEAPDAATIEAAFLDADVESLQETSHAVREAIEGSQALESTLTEKVGVGNSLSFQPLVHVLQQADHILTEQLERRGVGIDEAEGEADQAEGAGEAAGHAAGEAQRLTGEITSREDVIRALDKICTYYDRYEPSSPLPLLLKRAKRLATKSFLEILRDLTPDGLDQAKSIGGVDAEEEAAAAGSSGGGEAETKKDGDVWSS
jgi:type VI secretion system protein ImpA